MRFEERLRRLEALEQQYHPRVIYAVWLSDTKCVALCDGSREVLSLEEFRVRHPRLQLVIVKTLSSEQFDSI